MNESVTHEWVMSFMNGSCLTCMSHVTPERVMSYVTESCHMWMRHVSHEYMNESRRTGGRQFIHRTWKSRIAHEWVMSHINGSCPAWMSHVTPKWFTFGYFCTSFYLNTSRDEFVMCQIDRRPLPPHRGVLLVGCFNLKKLDFNQI